MNILPTVQRFIWNLPDGRVALFNNAVCEQWNGRWRQSDEPHKDYCGPTAGRNLLDWYSEEITYDQLGREMNTDNWMSTLDKAADCFVDVCAGSPECTTVCYTVFDNFLDVGTLPSDMGNALSRHMPPGYRIYLRKEKTGLATFENLLRQGDPIVVLIWTGSELHWTVVTGTEDSGATVMVELANDHNQLPYSETWDSFVHQWSLEGLDSLVRKVVSWKGFDPYIWMYYETTTELTAGQEILRGKSITSDDGRFTLTLDSGGNLVLYPLPIFMGPPDNHLWRSNTARSDAQVAIMQSDGNFVIYDSKHKALWASHTNGHPGAYLALQNDGNVVIYGADNTSALWATGTCCHYKTTELTAGQEILRGKSITSDDGRFILTLDVGGNLVLYPLPIVMGPPDNHLWRSNTAGSDAQVAIMQSDGNFVIYDSKHKALWASHTNGHPGAYLALQNDGNVVIYRGDMTSPLWATGTCCH